jgi:hypothetical protein
MLAESVTSELIVLCFNKETLEKFQEPIVSVARDRAVKIIFPKSGAEGIIPKEGIRYFTAGTDGDFFGETIFEKIFAAPIHRKEAVFRLECILIADDRESMLIYSHNGQRMAVIITLPFITCVQNRLFSRMIEQAHEIIGNANRTVESKNKKKKKPRQR